MGIFKLTPEITTGIIIIDKQHAELFERINTLIEAVLERKAASEVALTINFLDTYAMVHLGTEEEFMLKYAYSGYAPHKKQHIIFRENVDKFKADFEKNGASSTLAVFIQQWIGEWFINHIKKVDMLYVPYLKPLIGVD